MTAKDFYKWAKENNCLNSEIRIAEREEPFLENYNYDGNFLNGQYQAERINEVCLEKMEDNAIVIW